MILCTFYQRLAELQTIDYFKIFVEKIKWKSLNLLNNVLFQGQHTTYPHFASKKWKPKKMNQNTNNGLPCFATLSNLPLENISYIPYIIQITKLILKPSILLMTKISKILPFLPFSLHVYKFVHISFKFVASILWIWSIHCLKNVF